jgi:hypothetical protein
MSDIRRAKNFEGLLSLISEAEVALRENHVLLARTGDISSVMAAKRSHELSRSFEYLGRDIASGLVDLLEIPFDEKTYHHVFTNTGIVLESEPERRIGGGRRADDKEEVPA